MKCPSFIRISGIWILAAGFSHGILDTNNNGLSDFWERDFNNGNVFDESFDPQADSDADGWTNAQEAAAGTNPFDPNPPDGLIQPTTALVPAVLGEENGVPVVITPEAITVSWPTITGKKYTLRFSTDLTQGSWVSVGNPFIANGSEVTYNFTISQADKCFWRVEVTDVDTDGDGLTDHEEHQFGTNPASPMTFPGIPDAWLAANFPSAQGFDPYGDPDGDGINNALENQLGLDPNHFDKIGPVNLGFDEEITDAPDMSFRETIFPYPSDLYDQTSIPGWNVNADEETEGWQAGTGQHIEIWDKGDGNPYAELQAHLDAHGLKQEFNMLPGSRYTFILRYKGRYDYGAYDNAFDLEVEGASELLVDGSPATAQGTTRSHSFMDDDEWEAYADWHYATVSITAETGAAGLKKITLSLVPKTTTTYGENGQEEITYGGFVDLVPVEVTWKAIDGLDNVDDHIDPWSKPIYGKRIFPDFKNPDDTEIRHKLEVIVKTSPALFEKTVYVKAFDVDDSTSDDFDVDENGTTPVIDTNGKAGDDNLPDYLNTPQNGQFWTGSAWGGQTAQGTVDANGETKFIFRVGMQPGSNYRVVASVIDESMYAGVQTSDPAAAKYLGPETSQNGGSSASPLLTVWRRLWVENDSMAAIPTDTFGYKRNDLSWNLDTSTIRNVSFSSASGNTGFGIDAITDQSSFLNLDNGRMIVQSVEHPVVDTASYTVYVNGNHASAPINSGFRLYDDDDLGLEGSPLPRYSLAGAQMSTYFMASFIKIIDAVDFNLNSEVPFLPNQDVSTNLYGQENTVVNDARDLSDRNTLWIAPLTAAYQGPMDADKDGNSVGEGLRQGETASYGEYDHSTIFIEGCRENYWASFQSKNPNTLERSNRDLKLWIVATASHEIGHQPGHQDEETDHAEAGLMSVEMNGVSSTTPEKARFSPKTIKRFRKANRWSD